jgi:alkanesulfonate monooxygenase SsuD/methylene tetrahydromethanopterin reductase-like flavin-dependent oxidoreductase (luciferase family)
MLRFCTGVGGAQCAETHESGDDCEFSKYHSHSSILLVRKQLRLLRRAWQFTPPRDNDDFSVAGVVAAPEQLESVPARTLPIWIAVGGTPQSAIRAGTLGLPMAVAIIGGMPERFAPLVTLYRDAARRAGHDAATLPVGINSHAYIAETSQQAGDEFFPPTRG